MTTEEGMTIDTSDLALVDEQLNLPSSVCRACGLHAKCLPGKAWADPLWFTSGGDNPIVMVVVSGYYPEELSMDRPGGKLLNSIFSSFEGVDVVVVGTVRCPLPNLARQTPKDFLPTHRNCASAFLPDLQQLTMPDAIVLLGDEAMKVVLGKLAPSTTTAAGKKTIRLNLPNTPPIVVGRAPWGHNPIKGWDAKAEWLELFQRAESLAKGVNLETDFPYREITKVSEAVKLCEILPTEFVFDPEYSAHDEDPIRRSYWHPGAEMLCWSVVWKNVHGERQSATLTPPASNDPRVWEAAFRGRIACAHFIKGDLQTPYALLGIDVLPWMRRRPTGELLFRDPGTEIHVCNQSNPGLGILSLAMAGWGATNWKQRKDEMIAAANQALKEQWKDYNDWEKRRGHQWEPIKAWEKENKTRLEKLSILEDTSTTPKSKNLAQRWLADHPATPRPADPPQPHMPDKPDRTAGYEAAIPYLYRYCAEDSIQTDRAKDELVPQYMAKLGGNGELVQRLLARITELTIEVERVGLPVDEKRVEAAYKVFNAAVLEAKQSLLREPPVVAAVLDQKGYHADIKRGMSVEEAAVEYLNPGSSDFRVSLAEHLGVNIASLPRTKGGSPSIAKAVITELCQLEFPYEEAPYAAKIWRTFAKLKNAQDLISKLGMFRYTVDGIIRTDYRIGKVDKADHTGAGEGSSSGTETGRLSAGYLQGLKKDPAFRALFVAPPGWIFVEADYSTLEPRILAMVANIPEWGEWFTRGLDLYCGLANRMYELGVSLEGVDELVAKELRGCIDKPMRDLMKRCFLAQMYMQGAKSLSAAAHIPLEKAESFAEYFHKTFPQLKTLQRKLWLDMTSGKPVTTPFGRQAYADLPHPKDKELDKKLQELHRHFFNFPIQGTGSDCCLWQGWEFMRTLQSMGVWGGPGTDGWGAVCNLIHDALVSLVRVEHFTEYVKLKVKHMENRKSLPDTIKVDLVVEVKAGYELAVMEEVDKKTPQIPAELVRS